MTIKSLVQWFLAAVLLWLGPSFAKGFVQGVRSEWTNQRELGNTQWYPPHRKA